jgi:hypothetical protein
MAQLEQTKIVEPFGEVNLFSESDGSLRVKATILMKPEVEGAQTGLAIDGSKSMSQLFGGQVAVSSIFGSQANLVEPVAQTIAEYLANFDSDGETSVIYWACGKFGSELQIVGDINASEAASHGFPAPRDMGTGTKLLPAIQYFTETRFRDCPWGIYLFITDGLIEDLDEVKRYTQQLAKDIAAGQREFTKLVIIGLGNDFFFRNSATNEKIGADDATTNLVELERNPDWQKSEAWTALEELDDLDEDEEFGCIRDSQGEIIDLWDHKLASNMNSLEEIFAEVVTRNMIIAPSAEVVGSDGSKATPLDRDSYGDGLPALLEFKIPGSCNAFTLRLPDGTEITQSIV